MGTARPHQIQSAVTYTIISVHEERKSRYSLGHIACIPSPNTVISGHKMKPLAHHFYMQFCVFSWLPAKLTLKRVSYILNREKHLCRRKKKVVQFQRFLHEGETRSPNEEVLWFVSPGFKLDSTNWMWYRMPTVSDRKEQAGAREGRGNEVTHYRDLWISNTLSYYFTT